MFGRQINCSGCGIELNSNRPRWHGARCLLCISNYRKHYYQSKHQHFLSYDRTRRALPERAQYMFDYLRDYRGLNNNATNNQG